MQPPLTERDVTRYESLFRSRGSFTLLACGAAALWLLLTLGFGTFYGVLGYDGFVSRLYRYDSGIALHGGKWYYLGVAPVLATAVTPLLFYATSRVDPETVLLRGRGMAWTFGVLHGFLLLAVLAMGFGVVGRLTPLLSDPNNVISHRGERLYPPYYGRILIAIAVPVVAATFYHRATFVYTYRAIQRLISLTALAAVTVFACTVVVFSNAVFAGNIRDDSLAQKTALMLAGTVLMQAAVLHAIHLRRWPQVLDAYGRGYCLKCGYDLRGTIAANREACPECGAVILTDKEQRLLRSTGRRPTPPPVP